MDFVVIFYMYFLTSPWANLLVFDPLQLPFDDHLSQIDSQLPLLYGYTRGEAQTLHCTDHVLHQVVAHRVVHLEKDCNS